VRFAERDGRKALVWKDLESEPCDGLDQFTVSRDERRIAWVGMLMKHGVLICDVRPVYKFGPIDEHNNAGRMRFSPDGKRFAWVRRSDGKDVVVCDDKDGRKYDRVMPPRFSADGRHLWYAAEDSAGWRMVCDGRETPPHEYIRVPKDTGGGVDVLRYIVQDGQKLKVVEVDWPTDRDWTHGLTPEQ
jgi:hypothetical protein